MKIVESLIDDINNLFSKYDIDEKIDFKISNIENFDYLVNNLVFRLDCEFRLYHNYSFYNHLENFEHNFCKRKKYSIFWYMSWNAISYYRNSKKSFENKRCKFDRVYKNKKSSSGINDGMDKR